MIPHTEAGTRGAPTVVLLHGGGLSARQWQPQLEALSDLHLLAPDLPEQGRSASLGPFTLEGASDQISELIAARAHGSRAHLVGLSLGGAVALTLMQRSSAQVESVLVSGTAAGLGRTLAAISLWSAGLYDVLPKEWLVALALRQFGIPPHFAPAFREDLSLGTTAAFTRHFTRALQQLTLPSTATVPTLVVVGGRETLTARGAARTLVRRIQGAQGVQVPGCGHVWNLEAPALFSELVRAWVTGEPLPGALLPLR